MNGFAFLSDKNSRALLQREAMPHGRLYRSISGMIQKNDHEIMTLINCKLMVQDLELYFRFVGKVKAFQCMCAQRGAWMRIRYHCCVAGLILAVPKAILKNLEPAVFRMG